MQKPSINSQQGSGQPQMQPVYLRVKDQLWQWILLERLGSQARLPAERELAQRFKTTRVTLRQSLGQLEAEGKIYRSNRRGWYVTPQRLDYDPAKDVGFYQMVAGQGYTPATETLSKTMQEVPEWLAQRAGLAMQSDICYLLRRRSIDGRSVLLEHNYINPQYCPDLLLQDTDRSLWQQLRERYDLQPSKRQIEFYPQALDGIAAEALGVNPGTAGLCLQRLTYDQQGRFLEFDQEYWIHDALKVTVNVA